MIIYLCGKTGPSGYAQLKWKDLLLQNKLLAPGDHAVETVCWDSGLSALDLNLKLAKARRLLFSEGKQNATVVVCGADWTWALVRGQLKPDIFRMAGNGARLVYSWIGQARPLYPKGPMVLFGGEAVWSPGNISFIQRLSQQPLFPDLASLPCVTEGPPTPVSKNSGAHVCDAECERASLFHFYHSDNQFYVGGRRPDGKACWTVRPYEARFYLCHIVKHTKNRASMNLTLSRKAMTTKVASVSSSTQKDVAYDAGLNAKKAFNAMRYKRKREGDLPDKVWLCRDAEGGLCPSNTGLALDEIHVGQFDNPQHCEVAEAIMKAGWQDPDSGAFPECLDYHMGPLVKAQRDLGFLCGHLRNHEMGTLGATVFYLAVMEDDQWGLILSKDGSRVYQGTGAADLLEWLMTRDLENDSPDFFLVRGLYSRITGMNSSSQWLKVIETLGCINVQGTTLVDLIPVIHAEQLQQQQNPQDDSIVHIKLTTSPDLIDWLAELVEMETELTLGEDLIAEAASVGLCSLGEVKALNTLEVMDRTYAREVDHIIGRAIPQSPPRGRRLPSAYKGGYVFTDDNMDRIVTPMALTLDFSKHYPTIITVLGLSPDNQQILGSLLRRLMALREQLTLDKKHLPQSELARQELRIKKVKLLANKCSGWLGNRCPILAAKMTEYGAWALALLIDYLQTGEAQITGERKQQLMHALAIKQSGWIDLPRLTRVFRTIYGDTDSAIIDISHLGDEFVLSDFMKELSPFLELTGLVLTPREHLVNMLPMGGKRYAALAALDFESKDQYQTVELITSSLPHTTLTFPDAVRATLETVVKLMVVATPEARAKAVTKVISFLKAPMDFPHTYWIMRVKVSTDRPGGHLSLLTRELMTSLSVNHCFVPPARKAILPYMRVIDEHGRPAHLPYEVWKTTTRSLPLDLHYLLDRFLIKPATTYISLSHEEQTKLRELLVLPRPPILPPSCFA